jgi:hypothetical protein
MLDEGMVKKEIEHRMDGRARIAACRCRKGRDHAGS